MILDFADHIAAAILSNSRQNRVSAGSAASDSEEVSELHEILESINDGIGQLFRFSILLRNNTTRDRYSKSNLAGTNSSFNNQFDVSHVAHKFPCLASKPWLIDRLGKAISQRRQYLRYCREHRDKTFKDHKPDSGLQTGRQLLSSVPYTPTQQLQPSRSVASGPVSTLAHTQASTLVLITDKLTDEEFDDDTQSRTSYATSVDETIAVSNLHVVPIESISQGSAHFECVYCWQIQSMKNQKVWKYVHLFLEHRIIS